MLVSDGVATLGDTKPSEILTATLKENSQDLPIHTVPLGDSTEGHKLVRGVSDSYRCINGRV